MDNRSFEQALAEALEQARDEHHVQVIMGNEKHAEWIPWYARFITAKLRPLLTALQEHETVCKRTGVTLTVDGAALPPFYTRKTQVEIANEISSKYHVGE